MLEGGGLGQQKLETQRDEQKTNLIKPNLVCRSMMQKKYIHSMPMKVCGCSAKCEYTLTHNGPKLKFVRQKILAACIQKLKRLKIRVFGQKLIYRKLIN